MKPLMSEKGRKGERKRTLGHVEFLDHEEIKDDETPDNNVSDINIDIDLVQSQNTRKSSQEARKKIRQQKTASSLVTGGALTFVVLAAVLVTASLLLSPAIEELFGNILILKIILETNKISVFRNLNSSLENQTDPMNSYVNNSSNL